MQNGADQIGIAKAPQLKKIITLLNRQHLNQSLHSNDQHQQSCTSDH